MLLVYSQNGNSNVLEFSYLFCNENTEKRCSTFTMRQCVDIGQDIFTHIGYIVPQIELFE